MIDDTTRLRALCERAALPACEARLLRDDGAWCVVVPQGGEFCAVIAELSWSGVEPFGGGAVTEARAQLYAEAPAAIVGLCDARDQLVADAAATAARSVEEWADVARLVGLDRTALPLDVRRAVEHEIAERDAARDAADRVTAERDDLHAVLETRDAELTLAHERVAELEAQFATYDMDHALRDAAEQAELLQHGAERKRDEAVARGYARHVVSADVQVQWRDEERRRAAAEREACAALTEDLVVSSPAEASAVMRAAKTIRARGEGGQ